MLSAACLHMTYRYCTQINASPSLSTTTTSDHILKSKLIHDIMSVVIPPDFPEYCCHRLPSALGL